MRTPVSLFKSVKNRLISSKFANKDRRIDKHIVVFESDDWGSIRMPNKKHWDELLKLGYSVDKRPYERFDTLESPDDVEALFEVLCKYKDCKGNHPVITANMLMANPDFERIEKSDFQHYYFESIAQTYTRYFGDAKVLDIMRQGYEEGVFVPQSHGREHFNVAEWMEGLQKGDKDLLTAFKFGMCGIAPKANPEQGNNMMVALRARDAEEQKQIERIISEGLQMFEGLWGRKSKTFVAPCFCWNEDVEKVLAYNDVELIQTARFNKAAYNSPAKYFYSGEKNLFNQLYSIRNCTFEPATNVGDVSTDALMRQVDRIFAQHKPAVFSTHRINYVGGLGQQNRHNTLMLLDSFLKRLTEKYPDVVFESSDHLLNYYMKKDENH